MSWKSPTRFKPYWLASVGVASSGTKLGCCRLNAAHKFFSGNNPELNFLFPFSFFKICALMAESKCHPNDGRMHVYCIGVGAARIPQSVDWEGLGRIKLGALKCKDTAFVEVFLSFTVMCL